MKVWMDKYPDHWQAALMEERNMSVIGNEFSPAVVGLGQEGRGEGEGEGEGRREGRGDERGEGREEI